jgi:hypothetical protein
MNKTPAFKVPLQTELRFHLRMYEQPHTIGGPAEQQKADEWLAIARSSSSDNDPRPSGRTAAAMALGRTPLQPCPRPRLRSRGEDKYKEPEAPSGWWRRSHRRRGLLQPPPPPHRRQESSAHRQIPTRILPEERSTDLRAEAPYRGKGRTAPEHERRPGSAQRLGRSSGARGATTALAARGGTACRASEPNALKLTTPAVDQPRVVEVRPSRWAAERPLP